ncbi:MAG: glutathione S-transferase family protein [Janthinobacterium lividum]
MITVHHLNFSRSTRILWLLEELGLAYRLVAYRRDAGFRAPSELKAVHPLGKAPIIEDGDLKLAESAAILRYIDDRYGTGEFSPPAGSDEAAVHDEWLHYAESSAGLPIMITLIGSMTGGLPPSVEAFTRPELTATLDYISKAVTPGPYLMGEQFTLADIQMSYLLEMARYVNLLGNHPELVTYLDRIEARPAFARAVEAGGPMAPPKTPPGS